MGPASSPFTREVSIRASSSANWGFLLRHNKSEKCHGEGRLANFQGMDEGRRCLVTKHNMTEAILMRRRYYLGDKW